jgi:outer membrane protein assembly factor BamB
MVTNTIVHSFYTIKSDLPIKYIQGLHFKNGNLYYGSNNGYITSVARKNSDVVTKWYKKISNRNIKSIDSFDDKHLLIDCDATHFEETSRTFICSEEDGNIIDSCSWKDTTIVQGIYKTNWLRCNVNGSIECKDILNDNQFKMVCKVPIIDGDYISCGVVKYDMLYTMSLNGKLTIIDIESFKIIWTQNTKFKLSTCINVNDSFGRNTSFIYIGNQKGEIYFLQLTDNKIISTNTNTLHNIPMLHIYMHPLGPICYFMDSTLQGLKFISFELFLHMQLQKNNNQFALSKQGLFTIQNENEIVLYNLNLI